MSTCRKHINDCYHLIADVRHSTLLQPRVHGGGAPKTAEFAARPKRRPPQGAGEHATGRTRLSPMWNKSPLGSRPLWEDLKNLLASHGTPGVVLDPIRRSLIYPQMPT
jgi:hypothetical protein